MNAINTSFVAPGQGPADPTPEGRAEASGDAGGPATTTTLCTAVLTSDRRLLAINAAMETVLARQDSLLVQEGFLMSRFELDQRALARALGQVLAIPGLKSGVLVLNRAGRNRPAYLATLQWLPRDQGEPRGEPRVRLTLADPDECDDAAVARFAACFRLTPTETAIVQGMVRGLDVVCCSLRLAIAPNTVRWHQKRIFAKTGTDGRSALILLFHRGVHLLGA